MPFFPLLLLSCLVLSLSVLLLLSIIVHLVKTVLYVCMLLYHYTPMCVCVCTSIQRCHWNSFIDTMLVW